MQSRELVLSYSPTILTFSSTKEKSDKQHRSENIQRVEWPVKGFVVLFNFEILLLTVIFDRYRDRTNKHPLKKPPFQNLTYAERLDRGASRLI